MTAQARSIRHSSVPVQSELTVGYIPIFLALAVMLGFRHPATWASMLPAKETPGLGLLWFATRREWRALLIAPGMTGLIAGVSYAMHAALWRDRLVRLISGGIPVAPPNLDR